MSLEQLKAFLEKLKRDPILLEKLKAAKTRAEVVSMAKEQGHEFTVDKINQLTKAELESVSGSGKMPTTEGMWCDIGSATLEAG